MDDAPPTSAAPMDAPPLEASRASAVSSAEASQASNAETPRRAALALPPSSAAEVTLESASPNPPAVGHVQPSTGPAEGSVPPAAAAKSLTSQGFVWDDEDSDEIPAIYQGAASPPPSPVIAPPQVSSAKTIGSARPPAADFAYERYELLTKLGEGGAGVVFKARDVSTGATVALKRIREDSGFNPARVRREIDAMRRLTHPGVVRILDVLDYRPPEICIVMELVPGGDLQTRLDRAGALSLEETLRLGLDLAQTLDYAHRQGVVHRDLKPANVLLAADGTTRLTDFGLALTAGITSLTTEAHALGTLDFMAPEQRNDAHSADQRSDVFSFGKTLYCAATGLRPHTVRESKIPPTIQRVLLRCLEDEPADRYQNFEQVAADLEAIDPDPEARVEAPQFGLVALDKHDQRLESFELREGENLLGVRAEGVTPEVDLTGVDKHEIVSRRHASLAVAGESMELRHLSQTNPTHLNGRIVRAESPVPVVVGDRIVLSTNVLLEVRQFR